MGTNSTLEADIKVMQIEIISSGQSLGSSLRDHAERRLRSALAWDGGHVGRALVRLSQVVRGGEANYIMATVTLYVAIFNLFTSLLHLLGFAGDNE